MKHSKLDTLRKEDFMNLGKQSLLLIAFSLLTVGSIDHTSIFSFGTYAMASSKIGDLSKFNKIASDTLDLVKSKNLRGAKDRIKDLETSWDEAEPSLKPRNAQEWHVVDKGIDRALTAVRTDPPDQGTCEKAMGELITIFNQAEGK